MSRHHPLPVWIAAMDLAVHLEHAVRRFPRYHKYTVGTELCHTTLQSLCRALVALPPLPNRICFESEAYPC